MIALSVRRNMRVRHAAGLLWLCVWAVVLFEADRPWRELGGLLGERMRWLERFVLGSAFVVGCLVGTLARDATGDAESHRPIPLPRRAWLVPSLCVVVAMIGLESRGAWPWVLLLLAGWLAYWCGLDVSRGAWPLLRPDVADEDAGEL